ncbi:MAG: CehA/McbA family metallohydrolase [Deltaproteobacteria bacterium]|nr:CehA/McbA family metallohydrolase [Deltaproteobacteria bacterium]
MTMCTRIERGSILGFEIFFLVSCLITSCGKETRPDATFTDKPGGEKPVSGFATPPGDRITEEKATAPSSPTSVNTAGPEVTGVNIDSDDSTATRPVNDTAARELSRFDAAAGADLLGGYKFYFGNLHGHTEYSDGMGTPAEAFAWARDQVGFDFYAVTDHDHLLDLNEWLDTGAQAEAFTKEGVFLALRGFEYTHNVTGHINVLFTDEYATTIRYPYLIFFYDWLDSASGLAQFNHPGREPALFNDFIYLDRVADNVALIETCNKQIDNTDGSYLPYYTRCLDKGWRVAPAAGQDNHTLTAYRHRTVYLGDALSRTELFAAITARRLYSSDDPNMKVVFKYGDRFMGSVVAVRGRFARFTVWVADDEPIQAMKLITNAGETAAEIAYSEEKNEVLWRPWVRLAGRGYFFLKVIALNRYDEGETLQTAVTAPIWVR